MGALTSNRKRGEDVNKSLLSISPSYVQSRGHIAKKLKLSASTSKNIQEDDPPVAPNSVRSRIALYPDPISSGFREVHAPVRRSRTRTLFGARELGIGAASSKESTSGKLGSFFFSEFRKAKFSATRFFNGQNDVFVPKEKEKQVIHDEDHLIDISDDSGIEEVEVVDVLNCKWKEEHRTPEKSPNYEIKSVEKDLKSLDSSVVSDSSNVNAKLDVVEKRDLILLDQEPDASEFPVHKRLYNSSKKRDGKLQSLNYVIGFYEKIIQGLQFLRPRKKEERIEVTFQITFWPKCLVSAILCLVLYLVVLKIFSDSGIEFNCRTWPVNVLFLLPRGKRMESTMPCPISIGTIVNLQLNWILMFHFFKIYIEFV